jgi:myosin heavy subunit
MQDINKVGMSNFCCRCIKPNDKKMADMFDQERVMTQLKYTGVLETTRLRKEVGLVYNQAKI